MSSSSLMHVDSFNALPKRLRLVLADIQDEALLPLSLISQ